MPFPDDIYLKTCCRRIFVDTLTLSCRIGAYDHEKLAPQSVDFCCDIWTPIQPETPNTDRLEDVLNYDRIVDTIRTTALSQHFNLQETLADAIAERLALLPGIVLLRLTTAKTEAYKDVKAVGIEVWRTGSAFLR